MQGDAKSQYHNRLYPLDEALFGKASIQFGRLFVIDEIGCALAAPPIKGVWSGFLKRLIRDMNEMFPERLNSLYLSGGET